MCKWICMKLIRKTFILTVSSLLTLSCTSTSTKKKNKESSAEKELSSQEKSLLNSVKAEVEVGRNMAGRLLQFYGIYQDEKL